MWLEQREQGRKKGEVRAGSGQGQVVQGLVGLWEDLGLYPKGGRSPGGLWTEQRTDLGAHRHPVVAAVEGTDCRRRGVGGAQDLGWRVLALVQVSDDGGLDPMEKEARLLVFLPPAPPFLCYFK